MTARWATTVSVALLVFVIAMPAAGACCVAKPGNRMAMMHASMPCCADHCSLTSSNGAGNQDPTAISAPSPDTAVVVVATIAEPASPANASLARVLIGQSSGAFSPPPPFLLHSQFRI